MKKQIKKAFKIAQTQLAMSRTIIEIAEKIVSDSIVIGLVETLTARIALIADEKVEDLNRLTSELDELTGSKVKEEDTEHAMAAE